MAEYTLEQLLEDAVARQQRPGAGGHGPALRRQLAEVWQAVDRYASACLEQRRGVALPNLCAVGWQAVKLRGKSTFRPYFQLSGSFCRAHGAVSARSVQFMQDEDVCPTEDFSFSKAAIRFSSRLTKDQVSSGVRALVQQLGQAIGQGRSVSIDFSFGKLLSEEREVRMAFSPELYTANGLEVPSSSGSLQEETSARRPTVTFASTSLSEETLQGLSVSGTCALEGTGRAASLGIRRRGSAATAAAAADASACANTDGLEEATGEACGSRSALLQCAQEDALHRQITALETRASEALRDRAELEGRLFRGAAMDAEARAVRQAQRRENAEFLQQQMEESRGRRGIAKAAGGDEDAPVQKPPLIPRIDIAAMQRRDVLTSQAKEDLGLERASAASAPRRAASARPTSPSTAMSQGGRHESKREFREALDQQIQAKRERREAMQQFEKRVEASLLAAECHEVSTRRELEQAMRAREREVLGAAWRQEAQIKDIRKSIEAIELGKNVSGSKAGSTIGGPPLTQRAAELERLPGGSLRVDRSGRGGSSSGALSARGAGEALGAAALLALQQKAAAAA